MFRKQHPEGFPLLGLASWKALAGFGGSYAQCVFT